MDNKDTVIQCKTRNLWDAVQDKAFSKGYSWSGDQGKKRYDQWSSYKNEACIRLGQESKTISMADVSFYINEGWTVTQAEEYLCLKETTTFNVNKDIDDLEFTIDLLFTDLKNGETVFPSQIRDAHVEITNFITSIRHMREKLIKDKEEAVEAIKKQYGIVTDDKHILNNNLLKAIGK